MISTNTMLTAIFAKKIESIGEAIEREKAYTDGN